MQVTGFLDRLIILQLLLCDCQKKSETKTPSIWSNSKCLKDYFKISSTVWHNTTTGSVSQNTNQLVLKIER